MEVATAVTIVAGAVGVFTAHKSYETQKKATKQANKATQKSYDLQKQQSELSLDEARRKNRNLLDQQQSGYRAKLGAAGISSSEGSGRAAMDALQTEHDIEDKYLVNQSNISLEALLNSVESTTSRNLLTLQNIRMQQANNLASGAASVGRSLLK